MICLVCKGLGCRECHLTGKALHVPSDLEWKQGQPSLSAAIRAVVERTLAEPDRRSREIQ